LVTVISLSLLMRKRVAVVAGPGSASAAIARAAERGMVLSGTLENAPSPGVAGASPADEAEAHRMFHRVRDVVGENPDDAARVLREWIYQGQ
jgi:flagellar biosynthesis/type III secretory pathway M-ring protein FliF/YscJ